jgi:hypothetical protein
MPRLTSRAGTAGLARKKQNAIPHCEIRNALSDRIDDPRTFVPHDDGQNRDRELSARGVKVGSTNTRRLNRDANLPGPGFRLRRLLYPDFRALV